MSFRKRGDVIGTPRTVLPVRAANALPDGARPSPLDGRLTTSTGTASLDQLLAGHSGMPLGTSLMIEENGTTDFGGTLLRYFAAEGLVQGHHVHVLGGDESWRRELPGLGSDSKDKSSKAESADKMKIAWRYETLGNRPAPNRDQQIPTSTVPSETAAVFCHTFSLSKRLESSAIKGQLHPSPLSPFAPTTTSPFKTFLKKLVSSLASTPKTLIHRVVIPNLLSPTVYASTACQPQEVLQFLHGIRGLTRQYSSQLVVMITLPVSLYARSGGLVRWAELLSDGVLELVPLQQRPHIEKDPKKEDKAQGMLNVHSLPIFHEKGGGMDESWRREDLSFKLSASTGLVITPYSLPPIEDDEQPTTKEKKKEEDTKKSLEF